MSSNDEENQLFTRGKASGRYWTQSRIDDWIHNASIIASKILLWLGATLMIAPFQILVFAALWPKPEMGLGKSMEYYLRPVLIGTAIGVAVFLVVFPFVSRQFSKWYDRLPRR
jgi:hypothetical protein